MSKVGISPPPSWGADCLTDYLAIAQENRFATFSNKSAIVKNLIRIDQIFHSVLDGAVDPDPLVAMNFFFRAHSSLKVSMGAIMAGQFNESQTLLRLALEHAAYGLYLSSNDDLWITWVLRNQSPEHKKAVRALFTISKIKKHLGAVSSSLCSDFENLYEQLVFVT